MNEEKHLPFTSGVCSPVSTWSFTDPGLTVKGLTVWTFHTGAGGTAGSVTSEGTDKAWHFCSVFCISGCYKEYHQALNYIPIMEYVCKQAQWLFSKKNLCFWECLQECQAVYRVLGNMATGKDRWTALCSVCSCRIAALVGSLVLSLQDCHCLASFWPEPCMEVTVVNNFFECAYWLEKNGFSWFATSAQGNTWCLLCVEIVLIVFCQYILAVQLPKCDHAFTSLL